MRERAKREFIFGGNPTWRGAVSDQLKKAPLCPPLRGIFKNTEKAFRRERVVSGVAGMCRGLENFVETQTLIHSAIGATSGHRFVCPMPSHGISQIQK